MLLPRLLSSATQGKVEKFKRILGYYNVNFRRGALLPSSYSRERPTSSQWTSNKAEVKLARLHRRSVVLALKAGRFSSVRSSLKHLPELLNETSSPGKNMLLMNWVHKLEAKKRGLLEEKLLRCQVSPAVTGSTSLFPRFLLQWEANENSALRTRTYIYNGESETY